MMSSEGVQTLEGRLLVRGFPSWLTASEKESLLSHFGASEVIVMPKTGKMRNCAFATFASPQEAQKGLSKLHQLEVFGSRLVVELARPKHSRLMEETEKDNWECNLSKLEEGGPETGQVEETTAPSSTHTAREPAPTLPPAPTPAPPSHHLRYLYPPPTHTTLTNIANALACVPKLYVQVLHLMNKMNLPPPFGPPTPTPPLPAGDHTSYQPLPHEFHPHSSSEEEGSEIESDEDRKTRPKARLSEPRKSVKRRAATFKQVKGATPSVKRKRSTDEAWEAPPTSASTLKKIEIHVPSEIRALPEDTAQRHEEQVFAVSYMAQLQAALAQSTPSEPIKTPLQTGGILHAVTSIGVSSATAGEEHRTAASRSSEDHDVYGVGEQQEQEESIEVGTPGEQFISPAELKAHRLSKTQMREVSAFRNYSPGEPSLRLYIKNLAKNITEKELRYIFGRYIDWTSENQRNMFDIRVMQSGRMKGQAFVGLPSEAVAEQALQETNGYMLQGKPIVVLHARSTKPKDKEN